MLRPLAILLLLVATSAGAATRTSAGGGAGTCSWTAINSCFGGVGAATDRFDIAAGDTITVPVGSTVSLTTGEIRVSGTLIVESGVTLHYGDGSGDGAESGLGLRVLNGGTLRQEGALLKTCRIANDIAAGWNTGVVATHVVSATLDCDLTGVSTTTDYIFFGDEDPANLEATLTNVQVGPGASVPGLYRPAFNKWASYKITAAAGTAITWDLDPAAGTYISTPYAGYRYVPVSGGIAGNAAGLSFTTRWLKRSTSVSVPNAYSANVCTIAADRGSWYWAYDEGTGTCSGKSAKILSCTDGGAGADVLEVQGDVSGCTDAGSIARLTTGARRGDLVYIYRPATLNGNADAGVDAIGEGAVADIGGTWYAHWARMEYQWGFGLTNITPNMASTGNNIIMQGTSGANPTVDWDWVDIAYPSFTPGSDHDSIYIDSNAVCCASPVGELRYPSTGLIDLSGSTFRHIHAHDSFNNGAGGAGHGLFLDGAKNTDFAQFRIERQSDDGVVAQFVHSATATDANDVLIRHFLVYENIADLAALNSQEGFEFAVEMEGTPPDMPELVTRVRIQDVLSIGAQGSTFLMTTAGGTYKGITNGGSAYPGNYANFKVRIDGTLGDSTLDDATYGAGVTYGSHVWDSNINTFGPTTTTTVTTVLGDLHGSFVSGYDANGVTTKGHGFTGVLDRSVIDTGASVAAGGYIINSAAGTPYLYRRPLFINSVLRSTNASATRMLNNTASGTVSGNSSSIYRTVLLLGTPDVSPNGILVNFGNAAALSNSTTLIDGLFVTSNAATGAGIIAAGTNGGTVTISHACFETTSATAFAGADANGTTTIKANPLTPPASDATLVLRDLLNTNTGAAACAAANYPTALGYTHFRVGHAQLGDFEIANVARSSSDALIQFTPGSGGSGMWPTDPWPQ